MHVVTPGLDAQADRPNPDRLTSTTVRVNLTDGHSGPTYIFYYVPTASIHYQRELQHLRTISERADVDSREVPRGRAVPEGRARP